MYLWGVLAVNRPNEPPATPHPFILTLNPPHFPSNLTSPRWLAFAPTRTLPQFLLYLLSAVRHQPAPVFSINISMQWAISDIWTRGHQEGSALSLMSSDKKVRGRLWSWTRWCGGDLSLTFQAKFYFELSSTTKCDVKDSPDSCKIITLNRI